MHIVYIVGNRPQFIKLAILHQQIKQFDFIRETIIHTGQHFSKEMSDIFFDELDIELPTINLQINSLSHAVMIGKTMEALSTKIGSLSPDFVVVFGDTNATLAGALTAKKLNIPVIHIEAGIRTFDEKMPEESNRYITDRISDINFCCTYLGMQHLKNEGFNGETIQSRVINSGDLMLDAFYYYSTKKQKATKQDEYSINGDYILTTIHRKQNIEDSYLLSHIVEALNVLNKETPVICPLHPNTKQLLLANNIFPEFKIIPPQGYFALQRLLQKAKFVITDSGGLQREAFFAQKPLLILMEKPFWPEVLEHGTAICSSSYKYEILNHFQVLKKMKGQNNISIFGNGKAAAIIVDEIVSYHNNIKRNKPS